MPVINCEQLNRLNRRILSSLRTTFGFRGPSTCILLLCLVNLLNYVDRYTVAGILPEIIDEFHLKESDAGALQTVFVVSYMLTAPIFGYLGDRYNRKNICVFGLTVWTLAVFASSFVPVSLPKAFFFFRAVVGIGEASYAVVAPSILSLVYSPEDMGVVLMLFYITTPVGSGIGYAIGSVVTSLTGSWRWGLRFTPMVGVVILGIFVYKLENPHTHTPSDAERTSLEDDLKDILSVRSFISCTFGFAGSVFAIGAISWWAPAILEFAYGALHGTSYIPEGIKIWINLRFGVITCLGGIIGVALGTIISRFCVTVRRKRGFVQPQYFDDMLICAAGSFIAIPLVFVSLMTMIAFGTISWLFIAFAVVSVCMNWALNMDIVLSVIVEERRAMASAILTLCSHLFGDAVSPYIVGALADDFRVGDSVIDSFYASRNALLIVTFGLFFSSICYLVGCRYVIDDFTNAQRYAVFDIAVDPFEQASAQLFQHPVDPEPVIEEVPPEPQVMTVAADVVVQLNPVFPVVASPARPPPAFFMGDPNSPQNNGH